MQNHIDELGQLQSELLKMLDTKFDSSLGIALAGVYSLLLEDEKCIEILTNVFNNDNSALVNFEKDDFVWNNVRHLDRFHNLFVIQLIQPGMKEQ